MWVEVGRTVRILEESELVLELCAQVDWYFLMIYIEKKNGERENRGSP
jgi:hypothetical protein